MHPPPDISMNEAIKRRSHRAVRWRVRKVRRALIHRLLPDYLAPQIAAARVPVDAEVVAYFGDDPERIYQFDQWLPVLEQVAERHKVVVVLRDIRTLFLVQDRTTLPIVAVTRFLDLMNLYDMSEFKIGIYMNNGQRNFQSLNNPRMLHVHVNHGESDKLSSFSNQVKAYDRVFVAGQVAIDRYREALIAFDDSKVVMVGRPQLDLTYPPELPPTSRRTVMYAPTWSGESASNNWTSLDLFGVGIVEQVLANPGVRLVYKPHPRVAGTRNEGVARAHAKIVKRIEAAIARDPQAGHQVRMDGNILAMFAGVDVLVGDVSSVTLDYLYLRPECPLFLTDRRDDRALLEHDSPLAAGADIVDSSTIATFSAMLASRLVEDDRVGDRVKTREQYFGDLQPGDSSTRFLQAVSDLVAERDQLLVGHRRVTTGDIDEHD